MSLFAGEVFDVPPLPRGLDSSVVVVLTDVGNCLPVGYAVDHREAGKGGAGPAAATAAGDLRALSIRPLPEFQQRRPRLPAVYG